MSKPRVSYFYDSEVGNYYYGPGHPMKPHRIRMAHSLCINYGLYEKMEIYRPRRVSDVEMSKFHSDDYVNFLRNINPDNISQFQQYLTNFNVGDDCPVFDGIYQFCQISAGGSVGAAVRLNHGLSDIVINWAGGLHHAKKSEASGFCYVNDIVLAILELLKYHQRVLYIDIDIHHGDGVEEAFYTTDRVMTVSFHKYGDYFPGTGDLKDIGAGPGKNYALNFPLRDGIDDESYRSIFRPILAKVMEKYRPGAVVLQCGADSLTGDRLGCFNLTIKGHADCIAFMKSFNVPLLVVGGGGYTIRNVARCWAYETAVLLDQPISDQLPPNEYYDYYAPDYRLHLEPNNMENLNDRNYLDANRTHLLRVLQEIECAPSVTMSERPPDTYLPSDDDDDEDPDVRISARMLDKRRQHDAELSDSADEGDGGRRDERSYSPKSGSQKRVRPSAASQSAADFARIFDEHNAAHGDRDADGFGNGSAAADANAQPAAAAATAAAAAADTPGAVADGGDPDVAMDLGAQWETQ